MPITQAAWLMMRKEDELRLIFTDVGPAGRGRLTACRAIVARAADFSRGICAGGLVAMAGLLALSVTSGLPAYNLAFMTKDEIEILDFILPDWESGLSQAENRWARLVVFELCGADGVMDTPDSAG